MTETTEDEGPVLCAFEDGRRAKHSLTVGGPLDGQGVIFLCTPCRAALLAKNKSKRCQYCGVPQKNDWKKTALAGFRHQPNCPRSDEEIIEIG